MFKVYLTPEQWARVCAYDLEIAGEVEKQQPEMFAAMPAVELASEPNDDPLQADSGSGEPNEAS